MSNPVVYAFVMNIGSFGEMCSFALSCWMNIGLGARVCNCGHWAEIFKKNSQP
jgi:hypothetical protein